MNDEIKEILNQLEYFNEEDYKYYSDFELNRNQIKQLLDYITNLQQENELLKIENKEFKKRLKKQVDVSLEQSKIIEKAIEYIENTPLYETTYDYNMEEELEIQNVSDETASNKLLDILNGRSDE